MPPNQAAPPENSWIRPGCENLGGNPKLSSKQAIILLLSKHVKWLLRSDPKPLHNMGIISKLCETGILLENGHISKIGKIEPVIREYLSMPAESCDVDLTAVAYRSGTGAAKFTRIITRNGKGQIQGTHLP